MIEASDLIEAMGGPPAERVPLSAELVRVHGVPRRTWTDEQAEVLAGEMSALLRVPGGEHECGKCSPRCITELRPIQAVLLYELGELRGAFGVIRVGGGKTLVSLLAPVVAFAQRPLLIIPAKLLRKTERNAVDLRRHWDVQHVRIMTYEWLGREQAADALERYQPDLVVLDEGHKARSLKAAVTRRLRRLQTKFPHTVFLVMSGTIMKRSPLDYWHLISWCLPPAHLPLPRTHSDVEKWAEALGEQKNQMRQTHPGALEVLCNTEERALFQSDPVTAARSAFKRRLVETPGVVATHETPIDATLSINAVEFELPAPIQDAFAQLRARAEMPDGYSLADGLQIYQHARELAVGFYYTWEPRPEKYWYEARKKWAKFAREVLKHSRKLDTELQVRRAFPTESTLVEWERVKNHFQPATVPVWLDDTVVRYCADWAGQNTGVVWCEHVELGQRLQRDFGLRYYGRKGEDDSRNFIQNHPPGQSMASSIQSGFEGLDLQPWWRGLITGFPPTGWRAEQLLGRQHRDGTDADEVEFDVLCLCAEHAGGFWQACRDCRAIEQTTGSPQKLMLAGIDFPSESEVALRAGPLWKKDYGANAPIE